MIDVQLKTTDPETLAYIEMHGDYGQIPEAMGRLYGWVAQHGMQPVGMPAGVYLTDPSLADVEPLWEVQAPVAGAPVEMPADESCCGIKRVDPHLVAFAFHRGPYEAIGAAYGELATWIAANGYDVVGPSEEVYFSDPNTTPPEDYLTEIRFPIAKR